MARETLVRAVAVGNRINVRAAETEASYVAELERIVALAAPHFAPDRPNLLVLTEMLGLPAALLGSAGRLARHAHTAPNALIFLALAQPSRIFAMWRRWRRISLVRALLLARTDVLYRPLAETLARLAAQYHTHIIASTLAPRVQRSTDPREIAHWGQPGALAVYLPTRPEVYNSALVFGPDGALLDHVDKVFLTKSERETLDLSPGQLEDVRVIPTSAGRLGIAISLDAFTPAYLERLEAQEAEIIAQPDANDQPWAARSATHAWQPAEWLDAVLGSIQPSYPHVHYNVCAMQTGNFFDIPFDGQSSITMRTEAPCIPGDRSLAFVGVDDYVDTRTDEPFVGEFLAVAPWVEEDPIVHEPDLALHVRRARLRAVGHDLLPGGKRAGAYRESVIWADLRVDSAAL